MNSVSLEKFIVNKLKPEAMKSTMRTKLAAGLLFGSKNTCQIAHNEDRCICKGYVGCSLHAETKVISNYLGKYLVKSNDKWYNSNPKLIKKIKLIVIRIDCNSNLKNARPCKLCLKLMTDIGIKRVSYSSGVENEIITEKVSNMISIFITIGSKISYLYQNHNLTKKTIRYKLNEFYPEEYYIDNLESNIPNKVNYNSFSYFINHDLHLKIPSYKIINLYDKKKSLFNLKIFDNSNNLVLEKKLIIC